MGKMALILLLGIGALVAVGTLNINNSAVSSLTNSVGEYDRNTSKNICDSGLELALSLLAQNPEWNGTEGLSLEGGTLTITVENTTAQYHSGPDAGIINAKHVTTTATYNGYTAINYAVIQLPGGGTTASTPPPFMNYALASGGNLSMNGNVRIRDDNNNQWNADVHTNGSFSMNGNNSIEGFLTYNGNAHSNPDSRLVTNITPNQNPDNLPNHSQTAVVEMPAFNPALYSSIVTQTINNNHTINGNVTLGTKENPSIILVNGDLNLRGNITGYGVLIVTGNINITGSVNVTSVDPNGSNLGIYTAGNINGSGNITLRAQVYASGNINLGGNTTVYGSLSTRGNFNFNGNVDINYRPATSELTNRFWNEDGTVNTGEGGGQGGGQNNELLRPKILSTING